MNAVRGTLREFGIIIPVGASRVVPAVMGLIEDADTDLPTVVRDLLHELITEIRQLEGHIRNAEVTSKRSPNRPPLWSGGCNTTQGPVFYLALEDKRSEVQIGRAHV